MKKTLITLLIVAVLGVGGYFGITEYQKAQAAKASTYSTVTVTRGELTAIIGATGSVRANQTAVIAWQTSGQIATIDAALDQKVTARLNPVDRSIVSLYLENFDSKIIAEITGLTDTNIRTRIHRIKTGIKKKWEENYGT